MNKHRTDILTFSFAGLCILCCFFLAYMPRHPTKEARNYITRIEAYEDHLAEASLEDIRTLDGMFTTLDRPVLYRNRTTAACWLRFYIQLPLTDERCFISIKNASLENIDVFYPDGTRLVAGKKVDVREIAIPTRIWNLPIPDTMDTTKPVYLRVKTDSIMWVPLQITTAPQVISNSSRENLLFGLFFGIIIAIFFVNLFSYLVMSNKNFLIYMCYLFSLFLYHLRVHGFMYFVPMPFMVLESVLWISLAGVGIFMMIFAKHFLNLSRTCPQINRILNVFIGLFVIQTIFGIFISSLIANYIAYITGFLVPLIILVTSIKLYITGFKEARFYLLALFAMFTGTLIWSTAAYAEAHIPANYFFLIGTSLDSLLFTLAIFDLMRKEIGEKDIMIEREKYYINLSRTDPLTGLYNRRYLNDLVKRLESEGELPAESAMIMLDLDNFKIINDTHGHLAGDMILTKTGSKIKKHIRKTDIACRYGGDEFLVFLPGANELAARNIAESIRSDILNDFSYSEEGEEIKITVSVGVSENRMDDSFDGLFLRADAALYQAKKTGRNRISVL